MRIQRFPTIPSLLFALLLSLASGLSSVFAAEEAATLYKEGMAAFEAQNWALAEQKLAAAYHLTNNPRAQYYLRQAKLKRAQGLTSESLEKKLGRVILPNIQFEGTDMPTALEHLRKKVGELSQGKLQPNLLYRPDPNNPVMPVITLQLSNVPVTEVLRYIGELTNTRFKYETYAVVGTPVTPAARSAP